MQPRHRQGGQGGAARGPCRDTPVPQPAAQGCWHCPLAMASAVLGPSLPECFIGLGQTLALAQLNQKSWEVGCQSQVVSGTGSLVARGLCLDKPPEAKSKQALSATKCSPVGQHVPVLLQEGGAGCVAVPCPPSPGALQCGWCLPAASLPGSARVGICGEPRSAASARGRGLRLLHFQGQEHGSDVSGCRQRRGSRGGCWSRGRAALAGAAVPVAASREGGSLPGYGCA